MRRHSLLETSIFIQNSDKKHQPLPNADSSLYNPCAAANDGQLYHSILPPELIIDLRQVVGPFFEIGAISFWLKILLKMGSLTQSHGL
jgi:hypothetical protein